MLEICKSKFFEIFIFSTCLKILLMPAYHSTDFEVHRNWLAITHSLPLNLWYYDETNEWTLDYPPLFAYFEWLLAKVAQYIDPHMLELDNSNYVSKKTKYFQCFSVIITDVVYAYGVWRMLKAFRSLHIRYQPIAAEVLFLLNIGLLFVDHIHFQYNGFLFGVFLLSISWLLEERYLLGCTAFATLLNMKHIFLYTAPAFGIYLLKFYCLDNKHSTIMNVLKLAIAGLIPFAISFGPFWAHLPQILSRLFPFKRGLTHAYWAPNLWALYNTADKVMAKTLNISTTNKYTSGVVQNYEHTVLPSVRPTATFILTVAAMLPVLIKLFFNTTKSESKIMFMRSVVLCSLSSFIFGWHVHEKAILITLMPCCFLFFVHTQDARYAFILSASGYYSLFPLLFDPELIVIRYSLYLAYIIFMIVQMYEFHNTRPIMNKWEKLYVGGFVLLPLYDHVISHVMRLDEKLPFLSLMLTSVYCAVGVLYVFMSYYLYVLDLKFTFKQKRKRNLSRSETKSKMKNQVKKKIKSSKE
uniref:Alpha-1,3-glucosyltransferase n=1 Tax=Glossina brevipalpis TaxID=37001 RepID=A0A1A9WVA2_9MUSC